ncbi:MAG: hypothetical protein ICV60_01600 [Pyrinomonadaceae bacterium]|nr:hypothetical protein [Pyrinomonadaceae bacterium]
MRRHAFPSALLFLALAVSTTLGQTVTPSPVPQTRPRTIASQQRGVPAAAPSPTPLPRATPQLPAANPPASTTTTAPPRSVPPVSSTLPSQGAGQTPQLPATSLAVSKVRARIQEAERIFRTRPQPTSLSPGSLSFVTLAALDPSTSQIHLITLPKDLFLSRGSEATITTQLGATVSLRIVRANGVNTAVTIFEATTNRSFVPLLVEYPIERNGYLREMAYYTSAHPALLSVDIVNAGKSYIRTMLDLAARRLRDKGVFISPQILDIAERLLIVEHVDHTRFRMENRLALYEEIFSLYALNELKTYNYSVSTAGAGGLVQMIPSTYQMIRRMHPGVGLNPDFVLGMRNHGNALEAMLLYMYDVWNNLMLNSDVSYALSAKWATPADLMAAGYNSNPARLPLYIRRAGASWRTQIPSETQMYLQIYRSVESLIPMKSRSGS